MGNSPQGLPSWLRQQFCICGLCDLRGETFGSEIVFTFGPLGFAFDGHHPDTFGASMVIWTILASLYLLVVDGISRPSRRLGEVLAIQAGTVVTMLGGTADVRVLFAAIAVALGLAMGDTHPHSNRVRLAGAVAAAFASLIKFSAFVAVVPLLLLATLQDLALRRTPLAALGFTASLVFGWSASGQRITDLWPWISTSLDLSGAARARLPRESMAAPTSMIEASGVSSRRRSLRSCTRPNRSSDASRSLLGGPRINSTQTLRTSMEATDAGGTGGQENGRRFGKSLKRRPRKFPS